MSSRYVRNTVWAYLKANWLETRVIEVENLFRNEDVGGDPIEEWVTMMTQSANEQQASIGAPGDQRWREDGALAFIAFVPSGTGTDRALELAEQLRDLFRAQEIDDGAGGPTITFRSVDPPDTALPSSVDASQGAWYGFTVSAIYYCDFCR